MPKPKKDETREAFLHRYMGDAQAVKDFPDDKQRFAVACSEWESAACLNEFGNSLGYNSERDGAESFSARHLQPGVVAYQNMKHPLTGKQGIAVLIEKEVIDRMRPTMKGVPVLNWAHVRGDRAETDKWIADGKAVGLVVGSRWEGADGWEHCDTMVWDKEAKANARNGFRVSNAWKEDEIDWTPGVHNGVAYDGRLVAAHYTHLAIVPSPHYEGAVIYANSNGGLKAMLKLFGIGKTEAVELDKEAALEVGGKKYPALEVVNAITAMEAEKAKVTTTAKAGVLADGDSIEIAGKKYSGLEVANALAAAEKAKAAAPAPAVAPAKEPAKVEAMNADQIQEKIDAGIAKALEGFKGDTFFNAVAKLAQMRPAAETQTKVGRRSEKERIEAGRKAYGHRKPVVVE